jgi:hypothetical protein
MFPGMSASRAGELLVTVEMHALTVGLSESDHLYLESSGNQVQFTVFKSSLWYYEIRRHITLSFREQRKCNTQRTLCPQRYTMGSAWDVSLRAPWTGFGIDAKKGLLNCLSCPISCTCSDYTVSTAYSGTAWHLSVRWARDTARSRSRVCS